LKRKQRRGLSATQILVLGFFLVITAGALLLHLPAASNSGESTPLLQCFFTAVSSTCVTGLVVVDTALHWSLIGQIIILCMIQIGGLGFMSIAVLFSIMVRRRISPREKIILANSYNLSTFEGLMPLVKRVLCGTALIEGCGALILSARFVPVFGWSGGIWRGVFHSVSAFCNAGFDLMGTYSGAFSSLAGFSQDTVVNLTITGLIMTGGIGFVVWNDLYERIRYKKKISVYTKLVLIVSLMLWSIGTVSVAVFEWNNPSTLGELTWDKKLLASFFQSVTFRTAGFSTIALDRMHDGAKLISMGLMFVGGASGSTAGGVKVATIALLFLSVYANLRGEKHISVFRRNITGESVLRAFSLCVIQFAVTVVSAGILLMDNCTLMQALYETFSASGTVGLSLGLTPGLSSFSLVTLMILMYFGRVGILTIAMAGHSKFVEERNRMQYADTNLMIG